MSITPLSKDILDLAENLKSIVTKCENENLLLLEILCNAKSTKPYQLSSIHSQLLKSCGDAPDNRGSKKSAKANLHSKMSHKEHLSMLIKNKAEENLKLRESNVKLKQESKVQDKRIRDLNHKIMLYERNNHENESQKILIRDLKSTVEKKAAEIRLLKQNLENVRVLVSKKQNKTKHFQEHQKKSSKSKVNRELKSKIEELLERIDVLLEKREQKDDTSCFGDKNYIEKKITNTLKKLMTYYSNLNKDEQSIYKIFAESMGSNFNQITGVHVTKSEIGIQTSDDDVLEEILSKGSVVSFNDKNESSPTNDSQDLIIF